jgi:hypothetical protein
MTGSRVCNDESGGAGVTCDFCQASRLTARYAGTEADAGVATPSGEDWNTHASSSSSMELGKKIPRCKKFQRLPENTKFPNFGSNLIFFKKKLSKTH